MRAVGFDRGFGVLVNSDSLLARPIARLRSAKPPNPEHTLWPRDPNRSLEGPDEVC
jgi:hypothetical protein